MGRKQGAGRLVKTAYSVYQAVKTHIQVRVLQEAVKLQMEEIVAFAGIQPRGDKKTDFHSRPKRQIYDMQKIDLQCQSPGSWDSLRAPLVKFTLGVLGGFGGRQSSLDLAWELHYLMVTCQRNTKAGC